jgi:hypothetical protein
MLRCRVMGALPVFRGWTTGVMAAALCNGPHSTNAEPDRGTFLRLLDALAAWQMRYSHEVISRIQPLDATMTGVIQPSSLNERSNTSPCDR